MRCLATIAADYRNDDLANEQRDSCNRQTFGTLLEVELSSDRLGPRCPFVDEVR
jgi:hypothetical protein